MLTRLCSILVCLICSWAGLLSAGAPAQKHALLIGCTRYYHLPEKWTLQGPANDIPLFKRILIERFGFDDKNITVLSEAGDAEHKPVYAHIKREFDRLAKVAKNGDHVVILMGGHGSQQPDTYPFDEPDGLDEIFLPADVQPWSEGKPVTGAIVDDELGVWTQKIADKGAWLWLIVDACHSGTLARNTPAEVAREVPPEVLFPKAELDRARKQAQKTRAPKKTVRGMINPPRGAADAPPLVALYAAQPTETAPEGKYDGVSDKRYGLLTYTLCRILSGAKSSLSYRELAQQIHQDYAVTRWKGPIPLAEGRDLDREILGLKTWPKRSQILLNRDGESRWIVSGGSLHGLTKGSILAVHPPAGSADSKKVLGHVKIRHSYVMEAVVVPCAYAKLPAVDRFPKNARCSTVYTEFAGLGLRLGLDKENSNASSSDWDRLEAAVKRLAKEHPWLEMVAEPGTADWLLRLQQGQVVLVSAQSLGDKEKNAKSHFGPYDLAKLDNLKNALQGISRARSLLQVAAKADEAARGDDGQGALQIQCVLVQYKDAKDHQGTPVKINEGALQLKDGDIIGFRLTNPNDFPVDVTLLFVDSAFGIEPLFPRPGRVEQRIEAEATVHVGRAVVEDSSLGLEHVVLLAVKGEGQPIDFGWLAQPSLEKVLTTREGKSLLESPLGRLFQHTMYQRRDTGGLSSEAQTQHQFRLFSWYVVGKSCAQ